jgi:arylsulfatase A-like enzyme
MGPGIKEGVRIMGLPMSVFDIAPTILYIYGITPPDQMKGRILKEIFGSSDETASPRLGLEAFSFRPSFVRN